MKFNFSLFIFLILLSCSGSLFAQFPGWTNYTNTAWLTSLYETDTAIYMGTLKGGMVKFDKSTRTAEILTPANSGIPDFRINDVVGDDQGNLWVGTSYNGLAKYDGSTWTKFDPNNTNLLHPRVGQIFYDTLRNGVWIFNPGSIIPLGFFDGVNQFTYYDSTSGLNAESVQDVEIDTAGNVWLSTRPFTNANITIGGGLFKFDGNSFSVFDTTNSPLPKNGLSFLDISPSGTIWIQTQGAGIYSFNGTTWAHYNENNSGLHSGLLSGMFVQSDDSIWVRLLDTLQLFDGNSNWVTFDTSNAPKDMDRNGLGFASKLDSVLWIPTDVDKLWGFQNGIWSEYEMQINEYPDYFYQSSDDFAFESNSSCSGGGAVWVKESGGDALLRFDGSSWEVFDANNSPVPSFGRFDRSGNLVYDGVSRVWMRHPITTAPGIFVPNYDKLIGYDGNTWTEITMDSIQNNYTDNKTIVTDGKGTIYTPLIHESTGYTYIFKYDGNNASRIDTSNSNMPSGRLYTTSLAADSNGTLWAAFNGHLGVYKFDGDSTWTNYNMSNSLIPSDSLTGLKIDKQGNVWMTFSDINLLTKYDGNSWTSYDSATLGIVPSLGNADFDSKGNYWVAVNEVGILKFDGAVSTLYNVDNGNGGIPFGTTLRALKVDKQDRVWIGSESGVTSYASSNFTPLNIDSAIVMDETCLQAADGSISVYVSGSSPINYQWNPAVSTDSMADNLTAGNYQLTVTDVNGCQVSQGYNVGLDTSNLSAIVAGIVNQSNGSPLTNTTVYLVSFNGLDSSVAAIDSTVTDNQGYYQFVRADADTGLYVKALPDASSYPNEMPTYYASGLVFQDAQALVLQLCDTTDASFSTIPGVNPGGPGFIGGFISQGAGKRGGVGDPVEGLTVLIINSNNEPVAYTSTNADGYFSFDDLGIDSYSIWVDKPYVNNAVAPVIELTNAEPAIDSLLFKLQPTYLELDNTTSIAGVEPLSFYIYPNPGNGNITIHNPLADGQTYFVNVYNVLGKAVFSQQYSAAQIAIDLAYLTNGVYYVKVEDLQGRAAISELLIQ